MSTASTIVAAIDSAVAALVAGRAAEVEVDGDRYSMLDLDKLGRMRDRYQQIVNEEAAIASKSSNFGIVQLKSGDAK
jgi:hypothetical protein